MPASHDPKSVEVKLSSGEGLHIEWADHHHSRYSFAFLRDACPCAACSEVRRQQGRRPGQPRPMALQDLGALGPPPRLLKVEPVGRYALRFVWEDGHRAGDYSWQLLRELCPCPGCGAASEATPGRV